ncbi:MAG TPA: serine/threonine-protein kinase [Drouetiella sp.]
MSQPDSNNPENSIEANDFGFSDTEFTRGQLLDGRYKVLSLLGRGGMGIVYRVEQIFLGQQLALKTIEKRHLSDTLIRRFKTEAKAAFAVAHPNIVGLYDFGILDDETPYIAMELVEGETLAERIKRGVLTVEEAIPIFVQICFGLAHAHSCGIIHRDIKPSNIMLLANAPEGIEGGVKILDFGVAKITQQDDGEVQALTRAGEIFGSPLYVSPEQCSGSKVDYRADIYSLGCVFFEALTGTPPFIGENALATMVLHQTAPIPKLREASLGRKFPQQMEDLVRRMLAKDPGQRIQNLGEAAMILGAIKNSDTSQMTAIQQTQPQSTSPRGPTVTIARDNFIFLNAAIAISSVVLTTMLVLLFDEPTKQVAPEAGHVMGYAESSNVADAYVFRSGINKKLRDFDTAGADDTALSAFEGYQDLQVFINKSGGITDEGLAYLTSSKVLVLKLIECSVHNVDNLCKLTYVHQLDLQHNPLKPGAVGEIATALKQLQSLNLINVDASEADLKSLSKSHSLINLELTPGKYSDSFLKELHEKLPQCGIHAGRTTVSKYQQMMDEAGTGDQIEVTQRMLNLASKTDPLCTFVGICHLRLAKLFEEKNNLTAAEAQAKHAYEVFDKSGDIKNQVEPLILVAKYEAAKKKNSDAAEKISEALDITVATMDGTNAEIMPTFQKLITGAAEIHDYDLLLKICEKAVEINQLIVAKKEIARLSRDKNIALYAQIAGSIYVSKHEPDKAKVYFRYYYDAAESLKERNPKDFCSAEIQLGTLLDEEPDLQLRMLMSAVEQLDVLGLQLPQDHDLQIHYLDACTTLAGKFAAKNESAKSIAYMRKALDRLPQTDASIIAARKKIYAETFVNLLKQAGRTSEATAEAQKYGLK